MKTKELIELLRKEDPSGEGYVRIGSNPIIGACVKEGYWDGPYSYIKFDKDRKPTWYQSTLGYKIDILTMDLYELAERYAGNWEEVKKHIKITYNYLDDKHEKEFLDFAKKECEQYREIEESLYKQSLEEMRENAKKGWTWFQNKDVDKNEKPNLHVYYTWKIYNEKGKERMSTIHHTQPVFKSGEWIRTDNKKKKGYYEWIYGG